MSENEIIENEDTGIWKQKAINRRLELKEVNKRRRELFVSRENWKSKYMTEKQRADNLEKQLQVIKKKLNEILVE